MVISGFKKKMFLFDRLMEGASGGRAVGTPRPRRFGCDQELTMVGMTTWKEGVYK